jgi:hypothetical protein
LDRLPSDPIQPNAESSTPNPAAPIPETNAESAAAPAITPEATAHRLAAEATAMPDLGTPGLMAAAALQSFLVVDAYASFVGIAPCEVTLSPWSPTAAAQPMATPIQPETPAASNTPVFAPSEGPIRTSWSAPAAIQWRHGPPVSHHTGSCAEPSQMRHAHDGPPRGAAPCVKAPKALGLGPSFVVGALAMPGLLLRRTPSRKPRTAASLVFAAALAALGLLCPGADALTAITNWNIAEAVTAWTGGDATTYGNIVEWNTAAVTSMAGLFGSKETFNADISKWNVASVSSMGLVATQLCGIFI